MNIFTVAFFGHRYIDNPFKIHDMLNDILRQTLNDNEYVEFLVGRNGEFDIFVSSCIRKLKKIYRDDNSSLTLVLPYTTAEYLKNQKSFENYYDCVELSYMAQSAHPKNAISLRNKEMVDRADLIISFIEHNYGGAYKAVQYAKKQNKPVINLADLFDQIE